MARKAKPRKTARKTARKTTGRTTTARKRTVKRATTKRASSRKTTTRKKTTTRRKTTARKITAKPAARKLKKLNISALKQAYTKSQIMSYISDCTELTKKEVSNVFEALGLLMEHHLKTRGPGEFTVPGLMKCVVKRKPATKARKGINPFTGEPMTFKAKPARNIVKVRPLKKLKEMVV